MYVYLLSQCFEWLMSELLLLMFKSLFMYLYLFYSIKQFYCKCKCSNGWMFSIQSCCLEFGTKINYNMEYHIGFCSGTYYVPKKKNPANTLTLLRKLVKYSYFLNCFQSTDLCKDCVFRYTQKLDINNNILLVISTFPAP